MDKGNPHKKKIPVSPKEFGCAKYYWQLKSAIRRGSAGSEWGPQILKYADDFKLYPSSFLTWHRLLDLGKSTYLYFFAGTTSRISPKAQSHAAAEERFRRGGKHSDEQAIHRKISSKRGWRRKGEADEEMAACVCVGASTCKRSVWGGGREKSVQPPTLRIHERGIIEQREWQREKW